MNNKLIMSLAFVTIALLVSACGGQQQYVCADGTTVSDPAQCPEPSDNQTGDQTGDMQDEPTVNQTDSEAPPTPEEQPEEAVMDISDEVQAMMDTAEEKVNSFKFVYVGPPENLPQKTYYVMGNRILVELPEPSDRSQAPPYTHVYLNTERESAVGYCEVRSTNMCPNGTVEYPDVDFSEYYVKTPYQWIQDIRSAEVAGNGPSFEGRGTDRVEFTTKNGVSGEMFVVDFFGLPGKISLDNGDTIEFRDLGINAVNEEDVTPPET